MRIHTITLFAALMVLHPLVAAQASEKHNHAAKVEAVERENTPTVSVVSPKAIRAGAAQPLTLRLTDTAGSPLTSEQLVEVHTKKLHLFLVAPDFSEYQHVHPQPTKRAGEYSVMVTPQESGYVVWADITLVNGGHVPVRTTWGTLDAKPNIPAALQAISSVADITATVQDAALTAGGDSTLRVQLFDTAGKPIRDLEEFLGASAHLAGFDTGQTHLLHAHPMDSMDTPGLLQFHVNPPIAGVWKLFLQVQRGGVVLTFPFTLMVKAD